MTRSVVYNEYGGPEVLQLVDVDEPRPGPGQVRIAVRAAGVNQIDGKFRSGAMAGMRPVQFPSTPGLEVAGVIDAVGDDVTAWQAGDEVLAQVNGGYTTQVITSAATVGAKPDGMPRPVNLSSAGFEPSRGEHQPRSWLWRRGWCSPPCVRRTAGRPPRPSRCERRITKESPRQWRVPGRFRREPGS